MWNSRAKIYGTNQAQLAAGQDIGQDIITPSAPMCESLIRRQMSVDEDTQFQNMFQQMIGA